MRTPLSFVLMILFAIFHSQSFAMISVRTVTKEQAEELGIIVRAKPGGPKHAWIELEFKPAGKLEKFQCVNLEYTDGDELRLGWTPLKDERTHDGNVIVRVMGSRAFLEKLTLRIVHGDLGGVGDDVRIKDFVNFDELDEKKPSE